MILYKYLPPARIDVLETLLIRFTPPIDFNDPFEFFPRIEGWDEPDFVEETLESIQRELVFKAGCEGPGSRLWNYPNVMFKVRKEHRKQLSTTDEYNIAHAQGLAEAASTRIGVLCLSETPSSIAMWSHYSDRHTGFVVGFDADHPFFNSPPGKIRSSNVVRRVDYRADRPIKKAFRDPNDDYMFIKNIEWAYEREFRILKDRQLAKDQKLSLFDFPSDSILSVIVGTRATESFQQNMNRLLDRQSFRHIEKFTATLDDKTYAVNLLKISR